MEQGSGSGAGSRKRKAALLDLDEADIVDVLDDVDGGDFCRVRLRVPKAKGQQIKQAMQAKRARKNDGTAAATSRDQDAGNADTHRAAQGGLPDKDDSDDDDDADDEPKSLPLEKWNGEYRTLADVLEEGAWVHLQDCDMDGEEELFALTILDDPGTSYDATNFIQVLVSALNNENVVNDEKKAANMAVKMIRDHGNSMDVAQLAVEIMKHVPPDSHVEVLEHLLSEYSGWEDAAHNIEEQLVVHIKSADCSKPYTQDSFGLASVEYEPENFACAFWMAATGDSLGNSAVIDAAARLVVLVVPKGYTLDVFE